MNLDEWIDAAGVDEVPDGDVVGRQVAGRAVALYRIGSEVLATDATCTHDQADLCGGFVEPDGSIECPLHQGRFDIRSGRALCPPLEHDLPVHAVRIVGSRVLVRLSDSAETPNPV